MAKLSKQQLAAHRAAVQLLDNGRPLTLDEREQVFTDWHEGAGGDQTAGSAFFTPCDMASDMRFDMPGHGTLVDLCAGIGRLAYFAGGQFYYEPADYSRIVCIEKNPAFVEVGKRLFPEAEWICGDILDPAIRRRIGTFDSAISNPPFGTTTKSEHRAPRYQGAEFDLKAMDVAATLAPYCWAIVPADRAHWDQYQGLPRQSKRADAFTKATGHPLYRFSNVCAKHYQDQWRGVSPNVEIVGFGAEFDLEHGLPAIAPPPIAPGAAQLAIAQDMPPPSIAARSVQLELI